MGSTHQCDFCHLLGQIGETPVRLVKLIHSNIVADQLAKFADAVGLNHEVPKPHVLLCEEPHQKISQTSHYQQFMELGVIGKTWYCKNCGTEYHPEATRFACNTMDGAFFVDCSYCSRNRMPAEPIIAQEQTLNLILACQSCGDGEPLKPGTDFLQHCSRCGDNVQVLRTVEYCWPRKKVTPIPESVGAMDSKARCRACGSQLFSSRLEFCTSCGSKQ